MTEKRLLILGSVFLGVYALALTLSPAVRLHSWQADYRWDHWLGVAAWGVFVWLGHTQLNKRLPERDEFIFPLAVLLSGWGMLTVWRLLPEYGLRQAAWLVGGLALLILGLRLPTDLRFLYRFKYVWLSAGLLITAATLFLGTNPMGAGPELWLGCCGVYMQPSEILKLLLIVYLAAYFADRLRKGQEKTRQWLALLAPTLMLTAVAMLLLVFQRDLGTASIFLILYATLLYLATGEKWVAPFTGLILAVGAVVGYAVFDVVHLRVEAWLNPWIDPTGRSYQIVQSLMAIASGGVFGRGPGMGSPGLVPVAHSDFIYAAMAEEIGLVGALALLLMVGLLVNRGIRAALNAPTAFQRYLAAGITCHLGAQSILIIGGNLRLLPLTGVTLPLVSYGGSSLVTSLLEVLLLLLISTPGKPQSVQVFNPTPFKHLAGLLLVGLAAAGVVTGWWGVWRGPDLVGRSDNVRRSINDRYVLRGSILSQDGSALSYSHGEAGDYQRSYSYPALGAILGYTDATYGQAGLEASLDDYLRGLRGNAQLTVWWNHLLYGQPPAGLDVRLTLNMSLQKRADELLAEHKGAIVLLNAQSGEILAMASHPSFDANHLAENWETLINDQEAPLVNRASLGLYPTGSALGGLLLEGQADLSTLPSATTVNIRDCAVEPREYTWGAMLGSGCSTAVEALGNRLGVEGVELLLDNAGFYSAPVLHIESTASTHEQEWSNAGKAVLGLPDAVSGERLLVSPLQMALAAASLSNGGTRPAPRLAVAVNTPQSGWVILPPLNQPVKVTSPEAAEQASLMLAIAGMPAWQLSAQAEDVEGNAFSWYLTGTQLSWPGAPLSLVVLLEEANADLAREIGEVLLSQAMQP